MTNELIKVLLLFALYGVLEIALLSSSPEKLAARSARRDAGKRVASSSEH